MGAVCIWGDALFLIVEKRLSLRFDTGGEVNEYSSGRLLHDPLKGRGSSLFRRFSPQPAHQLKEIDGGSNSHMTQMGFAQAAIARAPQAHCAHCLRMRPFNACPMAIALLELICLLPLAGGKERQHLLSWVQGEAAASGSRTAGPRRTNLTIALRKLHLNERFACILDGCPARTDPTLWTGDRLGLPIDGEVRQVVAGLRLIPVRLKCGANQVHPIARLRLDEIGRRDISRINEMVRGEKVLLSQASMDRGEASLIAHRSSSGLDMSDQLRGVFIAGLSEMHFEPHPQRRPFLAIAGIQVIGRVDELSCRQGWLLAPLSSEIQWLKLLLPDSAERHDSRQRFHPVRGGSSIEGRKQHPAIRSHLIGVLLALLLLLRQA